MRVVCPYDGSRLGCGVGNNDDSKYESSGWTKQDERGDDMVVEKKNKIPQIRGRFVDGPASPSGAGRYRKISMHDPTNQKKHVLSVASSTG